MALGLPPGFLEGAHEARDRALHEVGRILDAIHDVRDSVDALDSREEKVWRRDDANADGAGVAEVNFEGPRAGFMWVIERVATVVNGGAASIGALYIGQATPGMVAHVIDEADFYADDVGAGIFVPSRTPVVIRISGAPAAARVTAGLQIVETTVPE